jgi:hypothetical protein
MTTLLLHNVWFHLYVVFLVLWSLAFYWGYRRTRPPGPGAGAGSPNREITHVRNGK